MPSRSAINIEQPAQLLAYLRHSGLIEADEQPVLERLAGGVSNRTVLLGRENGESWVLKQALPKLRVEVDWYSAPERIHREAAGLRWLSKVIPGHAPSFVFEDHQHHILAMTAIPKPHINWKMSLLNGGANIADARSFGRLLAKIHNASEHHPELAQDFAERRFFQELRLEPYYSYTASQVPEASAFLQQLIKDSWARRLALVHGDYSPKNVLVYRGNLIILDYEVIHFGDPAFDIGFSLTHLLSKAHYLPSHHPQFLSMALAYWQAYLSDLSPRLQGSVRDFAVRHSLACCLARVAGRSPLEYLDEELRKRQKQIVLELLGADISDIPQLIHAFREKLAESHE